MFTAAVAFTNFFKGASSPDFSIKNMSALYNYIIKKSFKAFICLQKFAVAGRFSTSPKFLPINIELCSKNLWIFSGASCSYKTYPYTNLDYKRLITRGSMNFFQLYC